jgi:hypothetical protein
VHPRQLSTILPIALTAALLGCGGSERPDTAVAPDTTSAAGPQHIHGVGVNPADDSVMIATHTGLFRATRETGRAERVGDLQQDTMGFTVVGPDEFLGSGHPDARSDLPPQLGLIRSNDAGRSWTPVSLLGDADFHVLRSVGSRVYGYDSTQSRLLVSPDAGRSWQERTPPAPLLDLAVDPADPDRVLASSAAGLAISRDGGESWRGLSAKRAGLLAWTSAGLTLVDGGGEVHRSTDGGRSWTAVGDVGGQPAALSAHGDELLVALHTNDVKASVDAGATWATVVDG